ncbi:sulfatase [Lutibacter sp. TH_r2]|uniref:sulfatase family protein n=1 Tax=Lutibacter sp. TH_r2 TaxID=3082083 RepID=UPI002952C7A0|nr:sulfatase [Lutibacter sp. TH_r2]MDV7185887.1 sulfatase [Lutibacter sp. TH_r2]
MKPVFNNILKTILTIFLIVVSVSCTSKEEVKPNILWINCDDLGRELACYGNKDVKTPNMDKLAKDGVRFTNAYSNAAVCSASRSSQILGMYPSAANVLNHRTIEKKELPEGTPTVMDIFRKNGYFCTNGWAHKMNKPGKEDYNFLGKNFFDGTDWKERAEGQPFFAQVQVHEPHRVFVEDKDNPVNPDAVKLPGCYPDYPLIRVDWANYLESVQTADKRVGFILDRLEKEGLADNTIVILFGDHGRPHLRDKQWLYEGGLAIPLVVRYPKKIKAGTVNKNLISLVDVTASSLKLAGIEVPKHMHGKDVLNGEKREYMYGFRQRCGDAVDNIRSITDGRYKLIWNRMPNVPYMQLTSYKKLQYPAFTLYKVLDKKGELEAPYNQFMAKTRPDFELYDLKNDPNEFNNLNESEEYSEIQKRLSEKLISELKIIEKNMFIESDKAIEKAKKGSNAFLLKGFKKKGLKPDASDEEIIKQWEKELLNK